MLENTDFIANVDSITKHLKISVLNRRKVELEFIDNIRHTMYNQNDNIHCEVES